MARSRWQRIVKHRTSRWRFTPKYERRQGRGRQLTWPDTGLNKRSEKPLNSEKSVELLIIPQSCATSKVTEGGSLAVRPRGLHRIVFELLQKTSTRYYAGFIIGVKSWVDSGSMNPMELRVRCAGSPRGSRNRSLNVVRIRPNPCIPNHRGHINPRQSLRQKKSRDPPDAFLVGDRKEESRRVTARRTANSVWLDLNFPHLLLGERRENLAD